jgi:hypothetical protein
MAENVVALLDCEAKIATASDALINPLQLLLYGERWRLSLKILT